MSMESKLNLEKVYSNTNDTQNTQIETKEESTASKSIFDLEESDETTESKDLFALLDEMNADSTTVDTSKRNLIDDPYMEIEIPENAFFDDPYMEIEIPENAFYDDPYMEINPDKEKDLPTIEIGTFTENQQIEKYKDLIEEMINAKDDDIMEAPEDVISGWLENGYIDEDMADKLRNEYLTYSDEDEAIINAELEAARKTNPDITREEVIENLTKAGKLGEPLTTSETPLSEIQAQEEDVPEIDIPNLPSEEDVPEIDIPNLPSEEDVPEIDISNLTPIETDPELEEKINELYDIINNLEDETVEIGGTTYNVEYSGNTKTLYAEGGGAGIQISSDGTVKICEIDSDGNISQVHGWQISDEELLNIFDRDLLSVPYSASGTGLGGNDLYVSGLADMNDEQWSKIEKFMDFADSGRVDLQYLAKIATLSDEDIERAYNMMLEDSSATATSVYNEIFFEQLEDE